jgi:hypothetical protein
VARGLDCYSDEHHRLHALSRCQWHEQRWIVCRIVFGISVLDNDEFTSADFPTIPGAFKATSGGRGSDAFVSKLNAAGSALRYSTYLAELTMMKAMA